MSIIVAAIGLTALLGLLQHSARPEARAGVVELVWATDDNPVRQEQMALVRTWYGEKYGTPIDIRIDPSNVDPAKVVIQSLAGAGPDVFDYFTCNGLYTFLASGMIRDVTDVAAEHGFAVERFWPALRADISLNGRQYGVPDNANRPLLLVNLDLVEQRGLSLPAPGWGWSDLIRFAQALTEHDATGRVVRYGLLDIRWRDLVCQSGATFFNAGGTRCTLDQPGTIEALQFVYDLVNKHRVMPSPAEISGMAGSGGYGPLNINLFTGGRAAMTSYPRFAYIVINSINRQRAAEGLAPLRIVPLPPLTGVTASSPAFARCTGINRRSRHQVEAVRFLEFLATATFNHQVNRAADSLNTMPVFAENGITGGRPPIEGCDDPIWVEALRSGQPWPATPFINGMMLDRILNEEMDRFYNGLQTPRETARNMERRVNEGIARFVRARPKLRDRWQALEAGATPPL